MKSPSFFLSVFFAGLFALSAQASERKPSEATSFDNQRAHFGLGVADVGNGQFGNQLSLSGLILFSPANTLQVVYGISSVNPVTMSGGLVYRGRVDWFENIGLHVGLGASIGTVGAGSALFANFRIPVGLQIRVANAFLLFLEGGPMVTVGGGAAANFTFGAFTANSLGAAVHYIF